MSKTVNEFHFKFPLYKPVAYIRSFFLRLYFSILSTLSDSAVADIEKKEARFSRREGGKGMKN
jgi:hypothetical protein